MSLSIDISFVIFLWFLHQNQITFYNKRNKTLILLKNGLLLFVFKRISLKKRVFSVFGIVNHC